MGHLEGVGLKEGGAPGRGGLRTYIGKGYIQYVCNTEPPAALPY